MTTRLPTPGADDGTWGDILNDFLSQAHNLDGSLKALTQSQISNLTTDLASKLSSATAATTYDAIGAAATAQTAAASDAATKVATHAGTPTAHARITVTDVLINRTGTGPPTDAMFTSPTDGMEYTDVANARKYIRVAGQWLYAALSAPSAFTPATLSGLVAWYDASQITGLADGDAVAQWNDLSGNGNHAVQATGANKPTYKTNIQNGKPVVRFNGTTTVLARTLGVALTAPYTIVVVGRASQGVSANECFVSGGNSTFLSGRTTGRYAIQSGSPGFAQQSNNLVTKTNAFVLVIGTFSTTPIVRVSGIDGAVGSWASVANMSNIYLGAVTNADYLNGDLAEVIVYNRVLTSGEVTQLETYLA
ncbi:MAG: hypothetical protein JWN38_1077 [Candidatus Saccharibacteria bacterium]|nr:hypothetical protein [Candidatus Saccharibacteria bacterium]